MLSARLQARPNLSKQRGLQRLTQQRAAARRRGCIMSSAAAGDEPVSAAVEDVVICGGGIVAASIAYFLTQRGVKPLVVERSSVGCAASGKAGGFLARSWGDGSPTQQLHRVSFDLHEQLAETLGVTSYRRVRTVSVRAASAQRAAAQPRAAPWLDGPLLWSDMGGETAQVTPAELTSRLMDAAVAAGAVLRIGVVDGVDVGPDGDVTAVRVDGLPVACARAVFAMGPWTTNLSRWLPGVNTPMEGILSASVVYRSAALRDAVTADPVALFCEEDARYGTHLEVYPRSNGELYVCGIGGSDYVTAARLAPGGDISSQESVAPNPARVAAAHAAMSGMVSLAAARPEQAQACMRPCAPDALPILGAVPGHAGAFVATGTNCWGILWAPVIGKAMSELLVDGASKCVSLDAFSVARFQPVGARGARGRKQGAAAVGEQW